MIKSVNSMPQLFILWSIAIKYAKLRPSSLPTDFWHDSSICSMCSKKCIGSDWEWLRWIGSFSGRKWEVSHFLQTVSQSVLGSVTEECGKPRYGNGARQTQDKWWPKGILKSPLLSTAYPDLISQHGILSIRRRRSRYSSLLACHLFVILINDASPREIRFLTALWKRKRMVLDGGRRGGSPCEVKILRMKGASTYAIERW